MKVYIHPKCSTCRKAVDWLESKKLEFKSIDIREFPPTEKELKKALATASKPTAVFNTSGQLYREQGLKDRLPNLNQKEVIALLRNEGMLVKRPFLVTGDLVLTGFKESQWLSYVNTLPAS
ncbi:MAG: Spx/MgsR family RNA polymerase-binding regulatory protein [Verrucomicrobiota bacterium]